MILYTDPASPNCLRVELVIAHAGRHLQSRRIDLASGGNQDPAYLEINPAGRVPALVNGDEVLVESHAIIQLLSELWSLNDLWPADAAVRARIARWQFWTAATLSPALKPFYWERVFKPMLSMGEPDEAALGLRWPTLRAAFGELDVTLAGQPYLVGRALTLADLAVAPALVHLDAALIPIADLPALDYWRRRIEASPAWRQATGREPT